MRAQTDRQSEWLLQYYAVARRHSAGLIEVGRLANANGPTQHNAGIASEHRYYAHLYEAEECTTLRPRRPFLHIPYAAAGSAPFIRPIFNSYLHLILHFTLAMFRSIAAVVLVGFGVVKAQRFVDERLFFHFWARHLPCRRAAFPANVRIHCSPSPALLTHNVSIQPA